MATGRRAEPLEIRSRPESTKPVRATIVLLHGWGSDAQNMLDSVSSIFPEEYRLVSIQAPRKTMAIGFMWYQMSAEGPVASTMIDSLSRLETTLDPETNLIPRDAPLFLVGFSQGGTIALSLATLRFNWMNGVACLSGSLLTDRTLPGPLGALKGMPVLVIHGKHDNVRRFGVARDTTRRLKAVGAKVEFYEHEEGHSIPPEAWQVVIRWVDALTVGARQRPLVS